MAKRDPMWTEVRSLMGMSRNPNEAEIIKWLCAKGFEVRIRGENCGFRVDLLFDPEDHDPPIYDIQKTLSRTLGQIVCRAYPRVKAGKPRSAQEGVPEGG